MTRKTSIKANDQLLSAKPPLPLKHVAIIMDGNRRWADCKRLPRLLGHKEGVKTLKQLVKHVSGVGLEYLTVYAFSSENWNRSQEEVGYLLELFATVLSDELQELKQNNVRLRFLGNLKKMPKHLQQSFSTAMQQTSLNTGLSLQVAINYGSRLEITEAIKSLIEDVKKGRLSSEAIDADLVSSYLYTKNLPDPDLIIRTGGERRLSNYLLWQAAYAELYITDVLWPEFSPCEFDRAIADFSSRDRRWGGD